LRQLVGFECRRIHQFAPVARVLASVVGLENFAMQACAVPF
jgi:hypothetical protein